MSYRYTPEEIGDLNRAIDRLTAVLSKIANEPDEENEWDAVDRFRKVKDWAREAIEQNASESKHK